MSAPDSIPPYVNGTLLLRDAAHARTVLEELGEQHADVEDDDDVEGTLAELLTRIANRVDAVFLPESSTDGAYTFGSQPGFSGGEAEGITGTIHIHTRRTEFTDPAVRVEAEQLLYALAEVGVGGYVEFDIPGQNPRRMVHVLTPSGVYRDLVESRFARPDSDLTASSPTSEVGTNETVTFEVEMTRVETVTIALPDGVSSDDLYSKRIYRWPDSVVEAIEESVSDQLLDFHGWQLVQNITEISFDGGSATQ